MYGLKTVFDHVLGSHKNVGMGSKTGGGVFRGKKATRYVCNIKLFPTHHR